MILSFKRDMTHNYMVPETQEVLSGSDYQIHMLMENRIGGLLPCRLKKINGKSRYFYDITSRQSMENIYEKERIGEREIRMLLKGLYRALKEVKRYLLEENKVLLDPQMIYMDIETKEPLFCYLPVYEGDILTSFGKFTEYILRHLDESDPQAVLLGYEIYRCAMEENYSLEKLLKKISFQWDWEKDRELERECAWENKEEMSCAKPGQWYGKEETERDTITEKRSAGRRNAEEKSREGKAAEQGNTERRTVQERSTEKNNTGERNTGKRNMEEDDPREMNRKRRNLREKRGARHSIRGEKKQAAMAAGVLMVMGLVGLAVWFWELNTTQLGGVAFLLAGILGYGFSAGNKHRKTVEEKLEQQEKRADRRSIRKEKKQKRAENERSGSEKSESERLGWKGMQREKSHCCMEETLDLHGKQPREIRKGGEEDTHESRGRKPIGATVVLCEGEEEYEPHLSLISMNPRERNSVVLMNDSYTIGKLKNKSDVWVDHPSISRIHARIEKEGESYYLQDMNSTNGTFINGRRLDVNEKVEIQLSDEIRFADLGYYVGRC